MRRPFVRYGLPALLVVLSLLGMNSSKAVGQQPEDDGEVTAAAVTVPTKVQYQGYVTVNGTPYNGTGYFKFAIVDAAGTTTYWSNNGTSVNGGQPTAAVPLTVSKGYFNVRLGSAMTNMNKTIGAAVFKAAGRLLRVWFATTSGGPFTQLSLTAIDSTPYAFNADTLDGLDGSGYASAGHKHFGETWSGSVGWSQGGLIVSNHANGPSVWGKNDGGGNGLRGEGYGSNSIGVYGQGDLGSGVVGRSAYGVGVEGYSTDGFGLGAEGKDDVNFASRKGDLELRGNYGDIFAPGDLRLWSNDSVDVRIDTDNNSSSGFSVYNGYGSDLFGVSENYGTYLAGNLTIAAQKFTVNAVNGDTWTAGDLYVAGNQTVQGSKSAVVATEQYGQRQLYAVESPEVWFEDVGSGQLVNGQARVSFEAIFEQTINTAQAYHVFVTPISDGPVLLSVMDKGGDGFTVRGFSLDGQPVNGEFEWRVIAKRLGYEGTRLEEMQMPGAAQADTPALQP
jgi:hypothetical protein